MRDDKEMSAAPPRDAAPAETLRDENGSIRHEFVEQVADAVARKDVAGLRALAGTLHEADAGDVLEALDPDLRTQFIELLGPDFDFTALTQVDDTVREEILDELPAETVAEGVREIDSDDAAYILEDLPQREQDEILDQLPPPERGAVERILDYPENSAGRRICSQ